MKYLGTISFVSGKGWFFAERDDDSSAVFIHQNEVEKQRFLKVDDRVEFDIAPSLTQPGKTQGVNVRYIGHHIAIQRSGKAVGRE